MAGSVDISKLSKKGQKLYTEFAHLPLSELLEKGLSDKDYTLLSGMLSHVEEVKKEPELPKRIEPVKVQIGQQVVNRPITTPQRNTRAKFVIFRDKKTGKERRLGIAFYEALSRTNPGNYEIIYNG